MKDAKGQLVHDAGGAPRTVPFKPDGDNEEEVPF
jgi:hypothetical protein